MGDSASLSFLDFLRHTFLCYMGPSPFTDKERAKAMLESSYPQASHDIAENSPDSQLTLEEKRDYIQRFLVAVWAPTNMACIRLTQHLRPPALYTSTLLSNCMNYSRRLKTMAQTPAPLIHPNLAKNVPSSTWLLPSADKDAEQARRLSITHRSILIVVKR
jgi:hypothetical protein